MGEREEQRKKEGVREKKSGKERVGERERAQVPYIGYKSLLLQGLRKREREIKWKE